MEDAEEFTVVMVMRSACSLLMLLTVQFEQLTLGKKGLVGKLGLVLEMDPVSGLMVLHCMLQNHDLKHLLGLGMREFTFGDKGGYRGRQGMDTLIGELADIREKFIPEMLIGFDSSADGIKGFPEHLLVLMGDGAIVNEGLISINVKGFQVF